MIISNTGDTQNSNSSPQVGFHKKKQEYSFFITHLYTSLNCLILRVRRIKNLIFLLIILFHARTLAHFLGTRHLAGLTLVGALCLWWETTFFVGGHAVLHVLWDGVLGVTQSRDVSVLTFTPLLISTRSLQITTPLSANTVVWNAGLGYVILG